MDTMTEIKGGGMSVFTLEELEVLRDLVPLVRSGVAKRIEDILDENIVWLSGNTIDAQAYKIDMCVKGSVCVLRMFVGSNFARFKIEYDHLVTTDTLSHFIDIWEEGIDDYIEDAHCLRSEANRKAEVVKFLNVASHISELKRREND